MLTAGSTYSYPNSPRDYVDHVSPRRSIEEQLSSSVSMEMNPSYQSASNRGGHAELEFMFIAERILRGSESLTEVCNRMSTMLGVLSVSQWHADEQGRSIGETDQLSIETREDPGNPFSSFSDTVLLLGEALKSDSYASINMGLPLMVWLG